MTLFLQLMLIRSSLRFRKSKYNLIAKARFNISEFYRFKEIPVKEIIRNVVSTTLAGKSYEPDNVKRWTISIANEVNEKVKGMS